MVVVGMPCDASRWGGVGREVSGGDEEAAEGRGAGND